MASCHRGRGVRGAWGASPLLGKRARQDWEHGSPRPPPLGYTTAPHRRWDRLITEVELAVTEWSRRLSCRTREQESRWVPETREKDN